jgi:isocitrate dehydrogenase (NAD+)
MTRLGRLCAYGDPGSKGADRPWQVPINWEEVSVAPIIKDGRQTIPDDAIESVRRNTIALKGRSGATHPRFWHLTGSFPGPLATPIGKGHVSLNLTLRRTFNLFANVRYACGRGTSAPDSQG